MPEKYNRFKLISLFAFFALPAAALITCAWLLSIYTPFFKSAGQILLTLIIALPLLLLSGYLTFIYITDRYLNPFRLITTIMQSILSRTFKPLPPGTSLKEFQDMYLMLSQLQDSLTQDRETFIKLNTLVSAEDKLFSAAVIEITDPLIVLNRKFEAKYMNTSAEKFTGVQKINALGKRVDQFVRFYDKNNQEILPGKYILLQKNAPTTKIFYNPETKIISNVNVQGFADVTVFQPELAEAIDVSCIILFQDKTKEKQLEAMKLDFVSMAAHELRTPLTSIKGYISVFINENQNKLTADQLMFIRRINTSTQQLSGLVENLLSVSRVERGAMNLHTQVMDWVENVKQQVETFEHRADEKRISLKFTAPVDPIPKVQVDLVRINEVLNNLISNALNYTEPMGKIEVWIDQKEDMVCTHVKDSGKGIPKEALPQLFSKFFRVQGGSAEQASKGNGLGLYLSKAIIELHHGKIYAESEGVGKGATFTFCLPAVQENIDLSILTKSV